MLADQNNATLPNPIRRIFRPADPRSRLRIRFAMRQPRRVGLAFPGSSVERSTSADDAQAFLIDAETGHFGATPCQIL
jgi:hypothetical protein